MLSFTLKRARTWRNDAYSAESKVVHHICTFRPEYWNPAPKRPSDKGNPRFMINPLTVLGWFGFCVVLMSFIEHQVHCHFMHRKTFLAEFIAPLKRIFKSHAIMHHGQYHKIYADEPVPIGEDRGIRLNVVEGMIEALPFSAVIAIFSIPCAIMFPFVAAMHHRLWNLIHLEMHKPEQRFFSKWPIYRHLARHHYLHHKFPGKNFNVVLPIADYITGTIRPVKRSDWKGLYEAGLLSMRQTPLPQHEDRTFTRMQEKQLQEAGQR